MLFRSDPVFHRSGGERKGRDGCRVPIPWGRALDPHAWLPQPAEWSDLSVEAQLDDDRSVLALYRRALALRPSGPFAWRDAPAGALAFARGDLTCVVNVSAAPLPVKNIVLASDEIGDTLPPGTAAWLR